jgi:hypothetical protein
VGVAYEKGISWLYIGNYWQIGAAGAMGANWKGMGTNMVVVDYRSEMLRTKKRNMGYFRVYRNLI